MPTIRVSALSRRGTRGPMLELRVVKDEWMPTGHDWVRYTFDNGRTLTVFSESFVRENGHPTTKRALAVV